MPYNQQIFFDHVRSAPFNGTLAQSQVDGMTALLAYIQHIGWEPTTDENQWFNYWNAYTFSTAYHETAHTMVPVTEYGSSSYLQSKRYWPYIGRGFVQITWKSNYERSDREIADGDLISEATLQTLPGNVVNQTQHMDQALNLEVAACNLMVGSWKGWYTGKKLWDYLNDSGKDYINARRIINGTDRANQIANYAENFESAFLASWQDEVIDLPPTPRPPPMPEPGPELPPEVEPPPDGHPYWEGWPDEIIQAFQTHGADEIRIKSRAGEQDVMMVYMNPYRK